MDFQELTLAEISGLRRVSTSKIRPISPLGRRYSRKIDRFLRVMPLICQRANIDPSTVRINITDSSSIAIAEIETYAFDNDTAHLITISTRVMRDAPFRAILGIAGHEIGHPITDNKNSFLVDIDFVRAAGGKIDKIVFNQDGKTPCPHLRALGYYRYRQKKELAADIASLFLFENIDEGFKNTMSALRYVYELTKDRQKEPHYAIHPTPERRMRLIKRLYQSIKAAELKRNPA